MSDAPADRPQPRPVSPASAVALVVLPFAALVLHLAFVHGYGYFRDELYYLACTRHLAWGYVDQPPLSIGLLWIVTHTLGTSLLAIRLLPALTDAAIVWLTGLMARRLGGGTFAQLLAMLAALVAPDYLGITSVYTMNAFDILFWTLAAYLLIRIFADDEARLWPWLGLVLGLGLLNKISVLWLGFGLACGLLFTRQRRWLRTPGPWVAGLIAGLLFLPYVLWQIPNHWATLEFMHNATAQKMAGVSPVAFVVDQILNMHPLTAPIWIAGLAVLLVGRSARRPGDPHPLRPLGILYLAVLLILIVNGKSRAGYLAPAYTMLFAAGALAIERAIRRTGWGWLRPAALTVLLAGGAITAPLAMPILPVPSYVAYARALGQKPSTEEKKAVGALPQFYADMQGWPQMVSDVARVYDQLSPADRMEAAIFAGNYGEAGAIDLFGPALGLPPAISSHNNYWVWGPRGYTGRIVVFLVPMAAKPRLEQVFGSVVQAGQVECGDCMPYEEHQPIFVCRDPRMTLQQLWPRFKNYN
ncbi:MAG: glycosyltransferase family 39 protein [Acidobacteriota bacterium]|nr:glycosyltransferase family 39 protein [Acidobacteriota bacterium]